MLKESGYNVLANTFSRRRAEQDGFAKEPAD